MAMMSMSRNVTTLPPSRRGNSRLLAGSPGMTISGPPA
jgi:hypothetical protein